MVNESVPSELGDGRFVTAAFCRGDVFDLVLQNFLHDTDVMVREYIFRYCPTAF